MNPIKSKQLVDICPSIFQCPENHPLALFGIECDDGWYDLLRDLIKEIKVIVEKDNLDVKVVQIKEKFGTLRFYMDGLTDDIIKAIAQAEAKSAVTCEICGKPGKLRKVNRWLFTSCDLCL